MEWPSLEDYFIETYFLDLLPLAKQIAQHYDCGEDEMIEAIRNVHEKQMLYPPTQNRTAWFKTVFTEKLNEARCENLTFKRRYG